jgi:hypothetical protein
MTAKHFKKEDRVMGNQKNPIYKDRTGTVAYMNGDQYWVRFDDTGKCEGGLHGFWLEPLTIFKRMAA